MGIFDIFKKKKKKKDKKNLDVTDLIKNDLIKVPEVKYDKIKINDDKLNEYVKDSGDNNKLIRTLPENDFPSLGGKIVGYHPHPKNFISSMYAVVEYPIIGEVEKSFAVNCSGIAKTQLGYLLMPKKGTWILFKDLGEMKDTDEVARSYGVATLVMDQKLFDMFSRAAKLKK